jgi:hypothetical protein
MGLTEGRAGADQGADIGAADTDGGADGEAGGYRTEG